MLGYGSDTEADDGDVRGCDEGKEDDDDGDDDGIADGGHCWAEEDNCECDAAADERVV